MIHALLLATMAAAPPTEINPLAGTWAVKEVVQDGRAKLVPPLMTLKLGGGVMVVHIDGVMVEAGAVKIQKQGEVLTFDFLDPKGKVGALGLYRLEGDKLTVCAAKVVRPARIGSPAGSGVNMMVMRRVKE